MLSKILGVLYRRFYNYAEGDTLKQLYLSLIRLHLEYACPVWDPHTRLVVPEFISGMHRNYFFLKFSYMSHNYHSYKDFVPKYLRGRLHSAW